MPKYKVVRGFRTPTEVFGNVKPTTAAWEVYQKKALHAWRHVYTGNSQDSCVLWMSLRGVQKYRYKGNTIQLQTKGIKNPLQ